MNYSYFFTIILSIFLSNQTFSQDIDDTIESSLYDTNITMRGKISEENGSFSLFYFDVYEKDSHAEFLQGKGYHGGGPSWLGIIYAAFNIFEPNILDSIKYDPQISGITFTSVNKEDLEMISRVISVIKSDEKIMLEMINRAEELDIMK